MKKRIQRSRTALHFALVAAWWCCPSLSPAAVVATWGGYGLIPTPAGLTDVKAIACGNYNLALRADGTLAAWGDVTFSGTSVPAIPAEATNVIAIASAGSHSLALRADHRVVAWGSNLFGESSAPPDLTDVSAIAAGRAHSVALKSDGSVVAWGRNISGETNVPPIANAIAVAAGELHNLALTADGAVIAWGDNSSGETNVPPGLSNVVAIAAGSAFSVALKSDGTVVAWGDDTFGETDVPTNLSNVIAIAAAWTRGLALTASGQVVVWGRVSEPNPVAVLSVPSGLPPATAIAGNRWQNVALVFDGPPQIVANPQSQIVTYPSNATFSVVATGMAPLTYRWYRNGTPLPDPTGSNATLVIPAAQPINNGVYTVIVSNQLGTVVSAGATLTAGFAPSFSFKTPDTTQRAGNTVTLNVSPFGTPPIGLQWWFAGVPLAGQTNSILILTNVLPPQSGIYSAVATSLFGSARADISLTVTAAPPVILRQPGQSPYLLVSQAPLGSSISLTVIATDRFPLTYQWRFNGVDIPGATHTVLNLPHLSFDQSGFYNVVVSNPYVEVVSAKAQLAVVQVYPVTRGENVPVPPADATNLIALAATGNDLVGLKPDGRVIAWSSLFPSQPLPALPVPANATNLTMIAAAVNSVLAAAADGRVISWGTPTFNTPPPISNAVAIANGGFHCLGVTTNGTVVGWGDNAFGESTPPDGLSNVVAVAAGDYHSLALRNDGTVIAWGNNNSNQTTVPINATNVIAIDATESISVALRADGSVVKWGNVAGLVSGTNSIATNAVAIACGGGLLGALRADGSLATWGPGSFPPVSNAVAVAALKRRPLMYQLVGDGSPAITIQPFGWKVQPGQPVQFHVRAAGSPPLTYQWQVDGVDVPGATNRDLIIPNARGQDIGGYRAVVSNSKGTATSRTAPLLVIGSTNLPAALNATNLLWSNTSSSITNGLWFAEIRETHDGIAAAQSGPLGPNQQCVLQTSVSGAGALSFWWKVSSEEGFDLFKFYADNLITPIAVISGETDWQQFTVNVGAGVHNFKWSYSKDASVSVGSDAAWLDEVVFTPFAPSFVSQPADQIVPFGSTVVLHATAHGQPPLQYRWQWNNSILSGTNLDTLTLTNVNRRNAGTYNVLVWNSWGDALSSNAVLTVRVPQRLGPVTRAADGAFAFSSGDIDNYPLGSADASNLAVQASSDLVNWMDLPGPWPVSNGRLRVLDGVGTNYPNRFYRVISR